MATYTCPKCKGADHIDVVVSTWRRLVQDDPDNIETSEDGPFDLDEEWDGDSRAVCRNGDCDFSGTVDDLQ